MDGIYLWIKKVIAAITAAIMSFTGIGGEKEPEITRPDANTVTAYSEADSDYQLTVDVGGTYTVTIDDSQVVDS